MHGERQNKEVNAGPTNSLAPTSCSRGEQHEICPSICCVSAALLQQATHGSTHGAIVQQLQSCDTAQQQAWAGTWVLRSEAALFTRSGLPNSFTMFRIYWRGAGQA